MVIITKIDDLFSNLFSGIRDNFTWATFFILLSGIMIGFILCATLYGVAVIVSVKNDKKYKAKAVQKSTASDEEMVSLINEIKKRFLDETEGFSSGEKMKVLSNTVWETINVIAGTYYPESKYPLYELNVTELLQLIHYLADRIDGVFDRKILRPLRRMSFSQVLRFLDTKKRIEEMKIAKAAEKLHVGKISKFVGIALNYANPVYWFKKLLVGGTIKIAVNKISLVVIDIVADETNKAYSKRIFNEESTLMHQEIENALSEMEDNDV